MRNKHCTNKPANTRSQEEDNQGEQNEEERPPLPPRPIRVLKPYDKWTKDGYFIAKLDNDDKDEIMHEDSQQGHFWQNQRSHDNNKVVVRHVDRTFH